jgi:hypothetical protein
LFFRFSLYFFILIKKGQTFCAFKTHLKNHQMPQKHWVENSSVLGGQVVECKNSQGISETKMPERGSIPYFERTHIISFYFILFYFSMV